MAMCESARKSKKESAMKKKLLYDDQLRRDVYILCNGFLSIKLILIPRNNMDS